MQYQRGLLNRTCILENFNIQNHFQRHQEEKVEYGRKERKDGGRGERKKGFRSDRPEEDVKIEKVTVID